jgi:hypothetical protein
VPPRATKSLHSTSFSSKGFLLLLLLLLFLLAAIQGLERERRKG